MYEICVWRKFNASHYLKYSAGRKDDSHSHIWKIEVYIRSNEINSDGILIDFNYVDKLLTSIVAKLKNKHLNNIKQFKETNPSAENISRFIYEDMKSLLPATIELARVVVWETPHYCAIYFDGSK